MLLLSGKNHHHPTTTKKAKPPNPKINSKVPKNVDKNSINLFLSLNLEANCFGHKKEGNIKR